MAENTSNKYMVPCEVNVDFRFEDGKTELKDFYFTAPLKVIKPWRQENGFLRAMIMSSSGGLMSGDHFEYDINIGENACAEIISQSYEKIFKMNEGFADRDCKIKVAKGAILNYMPQPTIPFAQSSFKNFTDVYLEDETSRLIYHEVIIAGRIAMDEIFQYTSFESLTRFYQADELIYRDNTKFRPGEVEMAGFTLFEGYTHLSNMIIVNMGDAKQIIESIRELLTQEKEDISFGVSQTSHGDVVVRILGREGNTLEMIGQKVVDAVIPGDLS